MFVWMGGWVRGECPSWFFADHKHFADEQIAQIQKIPKQRRAAHLEKKKNQKINKIEACFVTLLLKELHWLPVKYRIQYKLVTLAFRHLDCTLLPYLSSSLCIYQP